jgi:uncharacterized membrane protein
MEGADCERGLHTATDVLSASSKPLDYGAANLATKLTVSKRASRERLWELDVFRTIGIVQMVFYHTLYDINLFSPGLVDYYFWKGLQKYGVSCFLLGTGWSLAVSFGSRQADGLTWFEAYQKTAWRAAQVISCGMLISVVTFIAGGQDMYVKFGILHCIGTVMLMLPLVFPGGPLVALLVGVSGVALGVYRIPHSSLPGLWFLTYPGPAAIDHAPLLPWFGVACLGMMFGQVLYPGGRRAWQLWWIADDDPHDPGVRKMAGCPGMSAPRAVAAEFSCVRPLDGIIMGNKEQGQY